MIIDGYELKACPFCGKKDTVIFETAANVESCEFWGDTDCPEFSSTDTDNCRIKLVVCSMLKGGCGCSSKYSTDKAVAAEAWNRRVQE